MITRIEALNYRCLRNTRMDMEPFQILIGPNASGKTTFLDVVAFLSDLVSSREGLEHACDMRTPNFYDLVWGRGGDKFELAIELKIPDHLRRSIARDSFALVRYEVAIGIGNESQAIEILGERVLLKEDNRLPEQVRLEFPSDPDPRETLADPKGISSARTIMNKVPGGNDNYYSEVHKEGGKGWKPSFKLGSGKSTLGNMPADENAMPVSSWLKEILTEGVQQFVLNSQLIKKMSPPGQSRRLKTDGSNLPWVVHDLKQNHGPLFNDWIRHIRTALPDIATIHTREQEDIRHRYLMIEYQDGLQVPSWMASDGTLRLLALTLPAYLPDFRGVYLIEEPENGIHPRAVEAVFESLSSVYDAQIILATHSPVILGLADPGQILCFSKTPAGATDIVRGSRHPGLQDWKGEIGLDALFAGGVLG